jgi:predicted  nucleic acid-binding Zn-ribbon protein
MVSADELADAASQPRPAPEEADGRVIEPQSEDRPGLDELREELNSQFESIKIVSPGQYELNLMELYDRQEYIISLQEDGRYVIEVPGSWGDRED